VDVVADDARPAGRFGRWRCRDPGAAASQSTLIEAIGHPRRTPGSELAVVDQLIEVNDAASIAAARLLEVLLGRRFGGSSGTHLVACPPLAVATRARGQRGSIVSLLRDRGERYTETRFDRDGLAARGTDLAPWDTRLRAALREGGWPDPGNRLA
jgi:cysteine synthase A